MVFPRGAVVEVRLVAEHKLAPQLLVALKGAHPEFVPNVREVRKLHGHPPRTDVPNALRGLEPDSKIDLPPPTMLPQSNRVAVRPECGFSNTCQQVLDRNCEFEFISLQQKRRARGNPLA